MVVQRRAFQVTSAVLTLSGALLAWQGQKAPGYPSTLQSVKALPWASNGAKKSQPTPGIKLPSPEVLSAQQVFKRVSPSIMAVESLDTKGSVGAFGSGVVIASDRVITNRHVIEGGTSFRVEHGGKEWRAHLLRVDSDHDLAELSVPKLPANAAPVITRDSSTLAVGERVFAIGAPEGLELTISEGLISDLRDFGKDRVIQTSAAISPGSSGGGLFDAQGRLIGITTFYLKEGQSLNFALPAEWTIALERKPIRTVPAVSKNSTAFQELVWRELGDSTTKSGKYGVASNAYKEAIRLKPTDEVAWVGLASAYVYLKDYSKAISAFQESLRLKPNAMVWLLLSLTYNGAGQYEKGVHAAQQAVRLKPDVANAWQVLGSGYLRLELYDKAVNAEQQALRLAPDDGGAWQNLGDAYIGLKRFSEASNSEQEALRIDPDDARAWELSGVAYVELRQYAKAISAEQRAIELRPEEARLLYELGLMYRLTGQQSEVIKVYKKLQALDPKMAEKFFQTAVLP